MATALTDEACWEYLDPKGVTRGPFKSAQMVAWYDAGMLPAELRVRHTSSMPYTPIKELFLGGAVPFRSKPMLKRPEPVPKPAPAIPSAQAACACQWMYVDTKGNLQGPFASHQMKLWYEHKMLPKDLKLRRTTDSSFATISDFFPMQLGVERVPFKSEPVTPMMFHFANAAAKQVPPTATAPAAAQPEAATQPAEKPAAAAQSQPKGKAKAKAGKGAKAAANDEAGEAEDGKGGKDKGKGAGAKAAGKKKAGKKDAEWWSANGEWSGDKNWWEWSSWNGWSADGEWEGQQEGYGGKGGGAEWKGQDGTTAPKESKAEKQHAAQQQANGFGLKWGPKAELADLFPEGNQKRVLDEGIVWEERWVSPLAVRFSQGKIHPFFHERGPISEVLLQIHAKSNSSDVRHIEPPFPPMRLLHLKSFGVLVTLDNRRLYALQRFAMQEWPSLCLVKALCVEELTPTRLKAENRKFTNRTAGLEIEIESRSNAFDTFSWVTEAGRFEHARFCRPIAFQASDKALSLLPVLVVHMLLSPHLQPMLRSRWLLLQHCASILRVSQRRQFMAKRLMLNHVLELARPRRKATQCPQVCVGYQLETLVKLSKGKSCLTTNHTIQRPLKLLEAPLVMSPMQCKVLAALLPFFCLPYARTVLRGKTQEWVVGFLLAWGKVSVSLLPEASPVGS